MTPAETSRRERKKDETRERIAQAAIQLFKEKGFEATTVDEIAAAADVAKGTFFNYFPRKEAVLSGITDRHLDALEAALPAILDDPRDIRAKLLEYYARGCELYATNPDLHRHVILEMLKGPLAEAVDVDTRAQSLIRRIVEQGQRRGELRGDVDLDRATYTLRSVFFMTVLVWVYCPEMFDLKTEIRERLLLVLDGLATRGAS